ncbi:MAG: beta-ketoacyl-ACP synthase II [Actinomycetes bacterium]
MTDVDHRGRPRVAVTGIGIKAPGGLDIGTFWSSLLAGHGLAGPIRRFDASAISARIGCEVQGFDPVAYAGPKESRRMDRATQLGFAAAMDAFASAALPESLDPARAAVIAGTGVGGLMTMEEQILVLHEKGPDRVSPFLVPMMMANATAGVVSIHLGWTGPNLCVATACAAGAHAIGEGARLIRDGSSDVVLAGGTESSQTPVAIAAFARMGALSGRNDDPTRASRPFDADRDGFVMGEGAGFLVLERWGHATARGATILGEVLGYGRNGDAHHITAPAPGGGGALACMRQALDDAGLTTDDIGSVNAHGTSTPLNDAAESAAIGGLFGDGAIPVTSTKGVTGHLVGAAGAVEAIAALLTIRDATIPPTANHAQRGEDITADVVHGAPRNGDRRPVLSNSFGFGGHNAALILGGAP